MGSNNFFRKIAGIWNPERYQGWGRSNNYFEGWYFKLVSPDQGQKLAVIPGVAMGAEESHAFIQVIDGSKAESFYHKFSLHDFQSSRDEFSVSIDQNSFCSHELKLSLPGLKGRLAFTNRIKWPKSLLRPGVMGWYSYVPTMQCNHGLISMNHGLEGYLEMNGEVISFDKGKGYAEKDWGQSFPRSWIWTQCNNYQISNLSVMASVAHIPWRGSFFIGFLALIWNGSSLKVFTSYTGARMRAEILDDAVILSFRDRNEELRIEARQAPGAVLRSPIDGLMTGKVNESIQATHHITYQMKDGKEITATGTSAGLEVAGDVDELLTEKWRK